MLPDPDPPTRNRRGKRTLSGIVPAYAPLAPLDDEDDDMDYSSSGPLEYRAEDDVEVPPIPKAPADVFTTREKEWLRSAVSEIVRRNNEALRLFRPMPEQERFFASEAGERIVLGGNRGGKTTSTCVEIARAVTGQDPHGKYPETGGRCILVGKDLTHCSKVFYEKLFKPTAFKVIRDEATNEWRAFNPSDPADAARGGLAKMAPPLIPSRFYDFKKIAWENKKDEIPKTIRLKNGWTIYFFSSLGIPPQGWDVDLVVFDEEITHPLWYPEMAARLLDRRTVDPITKKVKSGKFIWGATPQAGTQQLYDLKVRADMQRAAEIELMERGDSVPAPTIECFMFGLLDNSFMSEHAKQDLIAKYADTPEEYQVRILGNFALLGMRVYGEFSPKGVHSCPAFPVPDSWTRYIAVDPGHQVCAILFCAIPPPGHKPSDETGNVHPGQKVIYDELYIKKCNATIFAERLRTRVLGGHYGQIIDHHAGRQTDMGSGKTHEEQYSHALRLAKVSCEKTGCHFTWGSDDVKGGIEAVRQGLHVIDGRSEWVVMRDKCPWLIWEAERYSYRKTPSGMVTDEPIKGNDHLMDCWRYLAMGNLKYAKPRPRKTRLGYTNEAIKRKKERAAAKDPDSGSIIVG